MRHRFRQRKHSVAARLLWLYIIATIAAVLIIGGFIHYSFRQSLPNTVFPHLEQYIEYIRRDIGDPANVERARELADRLRVTIYVKTPVLEWASDDHFVAFDEISYKHDYSDAGVRYRYGEYQQKGVFVINERDTLFVIATENPRRLTWRSIVPVGFVLLLLVVLYHATRRIFRPVETIERGIRKIGQGELNHRIETKRDDEFGLLAKSINAMADDIQSILEAKRQLLLAISHELRTPVTRAKIAAALLEDENQKTEIDRELNEIETLIEELLETERLSTRHRILNVNKVGIAELVSEVLGHFFVDVEIRKTFPTSEIQIEADPARLKLLIKNLLDNAIRHNDKNRGVPEIKVRTSGHELVLEIIDYGKGIEPHHLPHLAQPFYRADAARRRDTGGYGLGLYLCRVIAEAHGGRLDIKSDLGKGTNIHVNIPLKAAPHFNPPDTSL